MIPGGNGTFVIIHMLKFALSLVYLFQTGGTYTKAVHELSLGLTVPIYSPSSSRFGHRGQPDHNRSYAGEHRIETG